MKRTNVVLDEKLLEEARRVSGEKTYSATITKALEKVVKQERFWESYRKFEDMAAKGDFFWPGYLEEIRPNAYSLQKPKRVSAHDKRVSKKKARVRDSR
jgi:Bacterial antitoxin of type II TA system, VapB